jgi:hypothetical protein
MTTSALSPLGSASQQLGAERPKSSQTSSFSGSTLPTLYQYGRLSGQRSIRVLELLPDKKGAPLRCQMREVSLDSPPSYCAISYVWGSADFVKQIFIGSEVLMVTKSCSHVLHRLRNEESANLYWIDACCIDQGSKEERSHQVGMMGDIYSNSRRTVVWLGEEDSHSKDAMKYIRHVANSRERRYKGREMMDLWPQELTNTQFMRTK